MRDYLQGWIGLIILVGTIWPGGAIAEEIVEGKVIKINLTACSLKGGKPGRCEGTLQLETQREGEVTKREIVITRDVTLMLGKDKVFLPSLKGTFATITYMVKDGKNVATTVVAQKP